MESTLFRIDTNKIKGLMAEKGFTQGDMGKALRITPLSLRNKLSRRTTFTDEEICRLAEIFNQDVSIFFTRSVSK